MGENRLQRGHRMLPTLLEKILRSQGRGVSSATAAKRLTDARKTGGISDIPQFPAFLQFFDFALYKA